MKTKRPSLRERLETAEQMIAALMQRAEVNTDGELREVARFDDYPSAQHYMHAIANITGGAEIDRDGEGHVVKTRLAEDIDFAILWAKLERARREGAKFGDAYLERRDPVHPEAVSCFRVRLPTLDWVGEMPMDEESNEEEQ